MRNIFSVLVLTLFSAIPGLGQGGGVFFAGPAQPGILGSVATIGFAPAFAMTPVTGHPYSGEEVSESIQTLADGTHISQNMMLQKVYRDSAGRMRTERPLMHAFPGGPPVPEDAPMMIDITDPVAQVRYMVDTRTKVVHRWEFVTPSGPHLTAMPRPLPQKVPAGATPAVHPANQNDATRPQFKSEKLDPQTIEGIEVEGRRTTTTFPVGVIGNDRELVSTNEVWTSPELNVMILSKNNDPRSGERTQKLIHISRDEPDASLFQPPAGYTISDEKSPAR